MSIDPKWLSADELTMWEAAKLMAGGPLPEKVITNPIADEYEADYRDMYSASGGCSGVTSDELYYEDVNAQVTFLDKALKRESLKALRNPEGSSRELVLSKSKWLAWLRETGRYDWLVGAFSPANSGQPQSVSGNNTGNCDDLDIRSGANPKPLLAEWVNCIGEMLIVRGDTTKSLAQKVIEVAEEKRILSERGNHLSIGNVERMFRSGITGGRLPRQI